MRVAGIAIVVVGLVLAFVGLGLRMSDGPVGPLPGGPLVAGDLDTAQNVDWEAETRGVEPLFVELQLVEPPRSRLTGALVYDGDLYVPCDLGFIWRRAPSPVRWMLATIYRFKTWHEDALADGRAIVRVGGKRYERTVVRETDPERIEALRKVVESGAAEMFGQPLGEPPSDDPREIWFFRMDPSPLG